MLDTAPILPKAIKYAVTAHEQTLHRYDGAPYSVHLAMAAHYADMFSYLLPEEKRDYVLSAVWLHDTIEDCRITYNDLKKVFGAEIAEMVFAVTNNRGRTRDERADEDYYRGIRNTPYATFIKLCDRSGQRRIFGCFRRRKDDECLPQRSSAFLFSHKKRPARSRLHTYGKSA